ncbi:hypothetical protein F5Y11DRAFT_43094 [Daldinia sp. FL1419]|nr:hypothetical protein F5Y11DRAFT_43094 [Daldinia sp. FL1419]
MDASTRRQPRRAAQDKNLLNSQPPQSPKQARMSGPGSLSSPRSSPRIRYKRGAQAKAKAALDKKIAAMDPEAAWTEQNELLGIPRADALQNLRSLKGSRSKRKSRNRKKKSEEEKYLDDFLLSDEEDERTLSLRRSDRWIPDMEHRRRIAQKPKNVPSQLWMSYSLMDEYIFRQSLSDEEILKYPLIDDVFEFQNSSGDAGPPLPPGFQWNDKRRLVPVDENKA